MTEASAIFVRLEGRDVGLSTLLTQVDQKTQQSADSAARLQAQYARLAATQGNSAQSTAILTNALQNNGGASERVVVSLSQQLATMQRGGAATQQLATATQGLGSTLGQLGGQLSQLGGTAGQLAGSLGSLAGSMGTLGGIGAAIGIAKVAVDLSVVGANADLVRERFDGLAASANTTGDALLRALQAASGGEISNLNLELAANRAQILGVADSAEEMGVLLSIARDRAQQLGTSSSKAFDDLVTGLGRGSPLILDNLGIIVSVKEANEQYAASLGKTASALTEAEQKQALINAVLAQGRASLAATGGAVESNAGTFQRFGAAMENAKNAAGSFLSQGIAPIAAQATQTADAITGVANAANSFLAFLSQIGTARGDSAAQAAADTAATAAYSAELERSGSIVQANAAYEAAHAASLAASAQASAQAAAAVPPITAAVIQGGGAYNAYAVAANASAIATQQAAQAAQAEAFALTQNISKKQDAEQAAQRLSQVQAALASLGPAVAGGLQTAGSAAAFLATRYGLAYSEALKLINAQAALAGAAAKDPLKGVTEDRLTRDTTADRAQVKSDQALEANRKLLANLNKQSTAAGGVKLSDQQKLNNQLQTTQETANAKLEDAETEHQERLLKIQIDYAQKTLQQQKQNEISKRQSQEDFYDRLTSSDLNKKKGGTEALKAIDAQYQADFQKSQELAQQGKAKQSADLLALAQKQAQDELTYQENLAKAQEEKDKAEISRLEAIHKLHQDTANEERKQVLEGGDANEQAKQQALDEEGERYKKSQDEIGLAAERAAERQETAAIRAGKAVDATNAKLAVTKSTYDQIAPSGGGSAASTSNASAPPTVPTDTPQAAAANPLEAALAQFSAAQAAVERAVREAGRGVEGAIGRLGARSLS